MVAIPFLRARAQSADPQSPIGIIDIGSNSIRLVVYAGATRVPSILFNEKILAGLGRGLAKTGALDRQASDRALIALARFSRLARDMGVERLRTVATAAVRDASNGQAFLQRLLAIGLPVEVLPGHEEASLAGHGVLAGIPDAAGIVGDLGGGSLELVPVAAGSVGTGLSMPLGVLRVAAMKQKSPRALGQLIGRALAKADWDGRARGRPLYLVGGSWRALARLDMVLQGFPLPIIHQYAMVPDDAQRLVRALAQLDPKRVRELSGVASSRLSSLAPAASLLAALVRRLEPSRLVVSSYGLREGLLHRDLSPEEQDVDPLIFATREEGVHQGRFPEHGDLLDGWTAPLFEGEPAGFARLRHAACLLADVGWRAHPEFRAERGLDTALHGHWVAIDARGRAMLGQALYTHFGGEGVPAIVSRLASAEDCAIATRWGLAMRLGQRLSGGVAGPLESSRLTLVPGTVRLDLRGEDRALYGEAVERRHKALAEAMGRRPVVETE